MEYINGRREFLGQIGAFAAFAAAGCASRCRCGARRRYALQLYSINKIFWKSPSRILAELKAGGYDVVGLLEKYRGRHFSVHVKENVPTAEGVLGVPPTDGGKCVPWNEVVPLLKDDDSLEWWVVEAEGRTDSTEPPLKCLDVLRRWTA